MWFNVVIANSWAWADYHHKATDHNSCKTLFWLALRLNPKEIDFFKKESIHTKPLCSEENTCFWERKKVTAIFCSLSPKMQLKCIILWLYQTIFVLVFHRFCCEKYVEFYHASFCSAFTAVNLLLFHLHKHCITVSEADIQSSAMIETTKVTKEPSPTLHK